MSAPFDAVWKQIETPQTIRQTLIGHFANQTPLLLMIDFRSDALPAHIVGLSDRHILVVCKGMPKAREHSPPVYSLYGKSPQGDFLASGALSRVSSRGEVFTLTMPEWIDISPGPEGTYLQTAMAPLGHGRRFAV
jgi:hypothetical protein